MEQPLTVPDLLEPGSGLLDAQLVARFLATDIEDLAAMLGEDPEVVSADPAAVALQQGLSTVAFICSGLLEVTGGNLRSVQIWLNAPHPVLDDESPLALMRGGEIQVVVGVVDDLLSGAPA